MSKEDASRAFKEAVSRVNRSNLTLEDVAIISDNMLEAFRLIGRYAADPTIKAVADMAREARCLAAIEALTSGVLQDKSNNGQPSIAGLLAVTEARLELLKTLQAEEAANPKSDYAATPRITTKERTGQPAKSTLTP